MSDKGWIKLDRAILEHWLWNCEKPFDKLHAWIDILLNVNHTPKKMPFGDNVIIIEKGCMITSETKLSEKWGWSRKKVSSFLELLENDQMIDRKRYGKGTYLKLLNYAVYQDLGDTKRTEKEPMKNGKGTGEEQEKNTNKKEKNVKNEKNVKKSIYTCEKIRFAENVIMTNDEYSSLIKRLGEADTKRAIEILDNYKGSTGKSYKNDYRTILSWVVKALEEEKAKKPKDEFDLLKKDETADEFERIMWNKLQEGKNENSNT